MTSAIIQRALVTGASSGIGRATAIALAQAGYAVALVSRSADQLSALAAELQAEGAEAAAFPMDLAAVDQVAAQMRQIVDTWGTVDILINCAGIAYTIPLGEMPLADWQAVLNLNLTSPFQCIQGVLPAMRSQQRGTIVNVVSVAGQQVFDQWGAYCASKFGLMALTKTLALEERPHRIRVMAICPGAVNTALWDSGSVDADFDRAAMLAPEDVALAILNAIQQPAHVTTEELLLMPNAGTF